MRVGATRNGKVTTLAKKSKSQKNNGNNSKSAESESTEEAEILLGDDAESTGQDQDNPVVIEAEAVEVTSKAEISPPDDLPADDALAEGAPKDDAVEDTLDAVESDVVDSAKESIEPVMTEAAPVAPVETKRASALPLVIGGLAAGGIGYLSSTYLNPAPAPVDTTAIAESVADTGTRLEALSTELSELKAAPVAAPDLSGIENQIAGITTQLEDLDTDIAMVREEITGVTATIDDVTATIDEKTNALSERLTVLETSDGDEGAAATQEELAAFRAELDRMTSNAQARMAEAEAKAAEVQEAAAAKAAEVEAAAAEKAAAAEAAAAEAEKLAAEAEAVAQRQAAIVDLKAALESGAAYADILPNIGDVPEVLAAHADEGIPTLVSMQQSFPDAARSALSVAETAPQDASTGQKLTAFLRQQTNARSLKPVEGSGTDAVLSRAEAMLKQGDLPAALSELDGLSDASKEAMQDWLDQATTRISAIAEAEKISVTN